MLFRRTPAQKLGRRGERIAARALRRAGYRVLARRSAGPLSAAYLLLNAALLIPTREDDLTGLTVLDIGCGAGRESIGGRGVGAFRASRSS